MGATNKTPNLDLPQFVGTDKPSWLGDFNGAMNAIDTFAGKTTGDIGTVTATANAAKSAADAASASVTALDTTVNQHTTEISDTMADVSSLEADVQLLNQKVDNLQPTDIKYSGSFEVFNIGTSAWVSNDRILIIGKQYIYNVSLSFRGNLQVPARNSANAAVIRFNGNPMGAPAVSAINHGTNNVVGLTVTQGLIYNTIGDALKNVQAGVFYCTSEDKTYIIVPTINSSNTLTIFISSSFTLATGPITTLQVYVP